MATKIGSVGILFNIIFNLIRNVLIIKILHPILQPMVGKINSIDMFSLHVFTINFQRLIQIKKYHSFSGDAGH